MKAIIKDDGVTMLIVELAENVTIEQVEKVIEQALTNKKDYAEVLMDQGLIVSYDDVFYELDI